MPNHVLLDKYRHVLFAVMYADRVPDHLRDYGAAAAPGADDFTVIFFVGDVNLVEQVIVNKRAFFMLRPMISFLSGGAR